MGGRVSRFNSAERIDWLSSYCSCHCPLLACAKAVGSNDCYIGAEPFLSATLSSGEWQVANCDIGQGDGAAINLGNHRAIVIDTGPDPEVIDRCLKQLGVREIPLLIITHGHADHIAGWPGVTKGRKIGLTWYQNVKRGVKAQLDSTKGKVDIEVLWPDSGS